MTELERIRVPLAQFRNDIAKYVALVETSPVIVIITKHGKDVAALVNPEDIKRMDALIIHLTERARQVLAKEDAKQSAEARRLRAENREIDELMARAVQELFDGDPTLLREMATKYLES